MPSLNSITGSRAQLDAARARFGATYPTLQDRDGSLQRAYDVTLLPTLVVLDREGVVRHVVAGVHSEAQLQAMIEPLL